MIRRVRGVTKEEEVATPGSPLSLSSSSPSVFCSWRRVLLSPIDVDVGRLVSSLTPFPCRRWRRAKVHRASPPPPLPLRLRAARLDLASTHGRPLGPSLDQAHFVVDPGRTVTSPPSLPVPTSWYRTHRSSTRRRHQCTSHRSTRMSLSSAVARRSLGTPVTRRSRLGRASHLLDPLVDHPSHPCPFDHRRSLQRNQRQHRHSSTSPSRPTPTFPSRLRSRHPLRTLRTSACHLADQPHEKKKKKKAKDERAVAVY